MNAENLEPNSKEARGKRLRYIRKELLGLTRLEFQNRHKDLNITASILHNWEEARYSGIKESHAGLILRALEREKVVCEKNWLLYGSGNPPKICTTMIEQKPSNTFVNPDMKEEHIIASELRTFRGFYVDAVDTIISDDALSPQFEVGDYVGGIRLIGNDIEKADGLICIVQTKAGLHLTRKVKKGSKDGFFSLKSINPNFRSKNESCIENIELFSAAPIIFWRRSLSKVFSSF